MSSPTPATVESPRKQSPVQVPNPPVNRTRWWVAGALLLSIIVAAAGYKLWNASRAQSDTPLTAIKTAKAFVAPLDITLRIAGQTSARNFANIITPLLRGPEARGSMTLLKLAGSGAHVKRGEMLAQIDAQSIEDHIDDLKDTLRNAENDVTKRKAEQSVEWEGMQQTLRVARSQAEKGQLDFKPAGIRTDIERELLKLTMDEAAARYQQQQGDINQRKLSQTAEMRILEITLDRHKRHMGRHEHDLKLFTIHSPMDGLAVMSTTFRGGDMGQVQQGDQVYPGQPILKVVDTSKMQVEGSISQSDSSELRIGQAVRVGFDAFKELKFTGHVYSIGALAVGGWRQQSYIRSIPVRVAIDGSDPRLIPDLSASCDVIIKSTPDLLQIPLAGVQEEKGKATVVVRTGNSWASRNVTLGARNNSFVEVTAGLKAGEEVRIN